MWQRRWKLTERTRLEFCSRSPYVRIPYSCFCSSWIESPSYTLHVTVHSSVWEPAAGGMVVGTVGTGVTRNLLQLPSVAMMVATSRNRIPFVFDSTNASLTRPCEFKNREWERAWVSTEWAKVLASQSTIANSHYPSNCTCPLRLSPSPF